MRTRTAAVASLALLVSAGALAPAVAGPAKPKPIAKSYEVGPLTPDPTPIALGEVCAPATPSAINKTQIKIPAAGTLKVDIDFVGDWALGLRDAKGDRLAESDGGTPETDESMSVKFKKATTVTIEACNFAGAPTATVSYLFTFK